MLAGALAEGCAAASSGVMQLPMAPIEIAAPSQPLDAAVSIRTGSFAGSRASQDGLRQRFQRLLDASQVFTSVLDTPPPDGSALSLVINAADFGEPDAYTFELQATLVRDRAPISIYVSRQSARQVGGGQLVIGPEELGLLAERAMRDVVRQMAADAERLRGML